MIQRGASGRDELTDADNVDMLERRAGSTLISTTSDDNDGHATYVELADRSTATHTHTHTHTRGVVRSRCALRRSSHERC